MNSWFGKVPKLSDDDRFTPVRSNEAVLNVGRVVYAAGSIGLGVVGLIWADFANVWHPVPPEAPFRTELAYLSAATFVGGGLALLWPGAVRVGALTLAVLFSIFALLWVRRVVGFPHLIGTWSGLAEQMVLVVGAAVLMTRSSPLRRLHHVLFGLCLLAFGLAHLLALRVTAGLVPSWLPLGQEFWAVLTGAAHLLAGAAIVSNIRAELASRLLAAMFVVFGVLVWAPIVIASPTEHMAWAGNALNLALIGAAWIVAGSVSSINREPNTAAPHLPKRDQVRE